MSLARRRKRGGALVAESYEYERAFDGAMDLVVTGAWSSETRRVAESGEYDRLVLNYARGFRARTLDVVADLPLKRLSVLARTLKDVEAIYTLGATLEELSITSGARELRLDLLPALTGISADWPVIASSVSSAKQLKVVEASRFSEEDLRNFSGLEALTNLWLSNCIRLQALDGLESLGLLRELRIYEAPVLHDVSRLAHLGGQTLTGLCISGARSLREYATIFNLEGLQFLELSDCGPISSLAGIKNLRALQDLDLHGDTYVVDQDLNPVLEVPRLSNFTIRDLKSYTPRRQEVKQALARRTQA